MNTRIKAPEDMQPGMTHKTKFGDVVVVNYNGALDVDVKFVESGFEIKSQSSNIRRGNIRDPLSRTCHGVGFIGIGSHKPSVNGAHTTEYTAWYNMLTRCYYDRYLEKFPTYKGCAVCDEWHNFQNFAEWFSNRHKPGLVLDKDILIDGNKTYSPSTCRLVLVIENNEKAQSKNYTFESPDGDKVEVYNVSKFSKLNNLNDGHMCSVHLGKRISHKGWKKWNYN